MIDQQILGPEEDFEMSIESTQADPVQRYFNEIVMRLQQVILDEQFQSAQTHFMRQNCDLEFKSEESIQQLFSKYQSSILQLLIKKISCQIPNFEFSVFYNELKSRKDRVDQEIAQIVLSFQDVSCFMAMLSDYKTALEQQQRYRVLTIKSTKISENKKVKGNNENIFCSTNVLNFEKGVSKKNNKVTEKTLDQLFVPETVLTVKGLRKC